MKTTLEIAGLPIGICTTLDCLDKACEDYVTKKEPVFTVATDGEDIRREMRKSMDECAYEGIPYPGYTPAELENTAVYRKIAMKLPEYDALVFHGSAVAAEGKAFLFTAKSGTGKTTHTNLWLKNFPGSYIVNGDKPVLRAAEGTVYVCGTPWMGKEAQGCSEMVPLAGICFLNRGEKNEIKPVSFSEVMPRFVGQSFRPHDSASLLKTLKLIEKIGQSVPLYELNCNMDDEAAFVARRGMSA